MYKKVIGFFFILCCFLKVEAQIPKIESNVLDKRKSESLIYKTFGNKYDLLIAHQVGSGWKLGDRNPSQLTIKKQAFPSKKASELITYLTLQNFWNLNNDSLTMTVIPRKTFLNHQNKDTVVIIAYHSERSISVVDGSSYYFEILQKENLRVYSCNSPEIYLTYFPKIRSRAYFIKAKDAFENAIN